MDLISGSSLCAKRIKCHTLLDPGLTYSFSDTILSISWRIPGCDVRVWIKFAIYPPNAKLNMIMCAAAACWAQKTGDIGM